MYKNMAKIKQITPDYIFESSWEVCNKVGGIYTVLSTRAKTLQEKWKDNLIFIGPDLWENVDNQDFIEDKKILKAWKNQAGKAGLKVRTGRWNIPGKPVAVLVDFQPYFNIKNEIYFRMWDKFGVNSLPAYGDYDESCMFAYATGLVIESLYRYLNLEDKKVVAHLNEWMLGMAVLYLKDKVPAIGTVFTTHATSIGRSICGNNKPLYDYLEQYDGDQMAEELNMVAKHSLEKQAAIHADCFTTVSQITARECRQLLGRNPDVVTPNGFEFDFVPEGEAFDEKRTKARRLLIEVASRLCGEPIAEDALLLAISGRCEYKNKGIDVFIEALHRVHDANPERQVVAWILVPSCSDFIKQKEHKTKIIFIPSYLNGNDGIFNVPYYDLLIGLDLTIFPSYYEPWGYTPLESIAFGIPTITTNRAGFGVWAKESGASGDSLTEGVKVIERTDSNYSEIAENIKNSIINYSKSEYKEIVKIKTSAQALSKKASWSHFIRYYYDAYDKALRG